MSNQEDVQRLTPEEKELFDFLRSGISCGIAVIII